LLSFVAGVAAVDVQPQLLLLMLLIEMMMMMIIYSLLHPLGLYLPLPFVAVVDNMMSLPLFHHVLVVDLVVVVVLHLLLPSMTLRNLSIVVVEKMLIFVRVVASSSPTAMAVAAAVVE
jgi:hypothetical protein